MKKKMIASIIATMALAIAAIPVLAATPKSGIISENKAKEIALKDAGIPQKDVSYSEVEKDDDDGVSKYEVVIRKGYTEYSYDIGAKDGSILEHEVDIDV